MHRPPMQLEKNCVLWYFCLCLSSEMVRYVLALGDKDLIQGTWKSVGVLDSVKWRVGRACTEASDLAFVQGVRWGKL